MAMKYTTTAVLSLNAGVALGLSMSQAASRATVIAAIPERDGWYITTGPVQFKRGETFLSDTDLPKSLVDAVDYEDKPKAEVPAKAKATVRAKSSHVVTQPD